MWWLWIAGPLLTVVIFVLTDWGDKQRLREAELWRASWGSRGAKKSALPSQMQRLMAEVGGGTPVGIYELVARSAWLGVFNANAMVTSEQQTVLAKLEARGPTFVARPLPIVDGNRAPNDGVLFK